MKPSVYHIPPARPSTEERVLLALRAGDVSSVALGERVPAFHAVTYKLKRAGLIEEIASHGTGSYWRLTPLGELRCPTWRQLLGQQPIYPDLYEQEHETC
jgi:hypothetical protein